MRYRPGRWLVALCLLPVLATAAALGGAPYVFCRTLARTQLHCCCHPNAAAAARHDPPRTDDTRGGPSFHSTCCEGRRIASLPTGSVGLAEPAHGVPPAQAFALISIEELYAAPALAATHLARRVANPPRAGPEPPLFALHRAYLN